MCVVNQCFVVSGAGGAISSAVAVRKCQSNRVQPPLRGAVRERKLERERALAGGILPLEIANSPSRVCEFCHRLRVGNCAITHSLS